MSISRMPASIRSRKTILISSKLTA